tara:strand:+ start:2141 stop:3085 length:945 start_codon:yes stop_codon:yes gene_type:complete
MSNNFIENYTLSAKSPFDESFVNGNPFLQNVFTYAVGGAVNDYNGYWRSDNAQRIINEDTFNYIWNCFSDKRKELLNIAIWISQGGSSNKPMSLSKEFCDDFLNDFLKEIPVDDSAENNSLRIKVIPAVDKSYDYLSELTKFSLIDDHNSRDMLHKWTEAALSNSCDNEVYNYLWSQVKREKGATDTKEKIVRSAIKNNSLSDSLIAKIAKSSPKRIKRAVVNGISSRIQDLKSRLVYLKRHNELGVNDHKISIVEEKVAKMEDRAMLFVGCTDYAVVESLIDCLSRDNLPWLMPSASSHYWLSQKISRLIENS